MGKDSSRPSFLRLAALILIALFIVLCLSACGDPSSGNGQVNPDNGETEGDGSGDGSKPSRPAAVSELKAGSGGKVAVSLSWTSSADCEYIVVLLPAGDGWLPVDGTEYALADVVGGGKVAWKGEATTCSVSGLTIGQDCRFLVFAVGSSILYSPKAEVAFLVPEPEPAFEGFDFELAEGDFWLFDDYESTYSGYGSDVFRYNSYVTVALGAPTEFGGREAFPLVVDGSSSYAPRWSHLALGDGVLYGSADGSTWKTVFDAKTGVWKGGGFFKAWPEEDFTTAGSASWTPGDEALAVVAVGTNGSSSSASYVYVEGYGYVSDGAPTMSWSEAEYFRAGIGPFGYTKSFSYLDSSSQSSTSGTVTTVGSSFLGDLLEIGGSAYPASVQRLPLAGWLFGHAKENWEAQDPTTSVRIIEEDGTLGDASYQDFYYFESAEAATRTVSLSRLVGNPDTAWAPFIGDVIALDSGESPTLVGTSGASTEARSLAARLVQLDPTKMSIGKRAARIDNAGKASGTGKPCYDALSASFQAEAGGRYVVAIYLPSPGDPAYIEADVRYKVKVE